MVECVQVIPCKGPEFAGVVYFHCAGSYGMVPGEVVEKRPYLVINKGCRLSFKQGARVS